MGVCSVCIWVCVVCVWVCMGVCMGVREGVCEGDTVLEDIRYTQGIDSQRSQPRWRRGQQ